MPLQKDCEHTEDDFKRGSTADEMLANSLRTLGKRTLKGFFFSTQEAALALAPAQGEVATFSLFTYETT